MQNNNCSNNVLAYAGYIKNSAELLECSSGGIATALAKQMIREGGLVAGVTYSDDFKEAVYQLVGREEDIDRFKGSKYIGTNKNSIYSKVREALEAGRSVLFFGTPCTTAALYSFLKKPYDNLLTVDLICHGPTDPKVHRQYIEHLENKYQSAVVDFSVKKKKEKWTPQYLYAKFANGAVFEQPFYHTEYGYAFSAMALPACYSCQFRGDNRQGDIMIGDFWGADRSDEFYNELGISAILVRTEKGNVFLRSSEDISLFPSDFDRIVAKNRNILFPRSPISVTKKFTKLLESHDLFYSVKHSKPIKTRIKAFVKGILKA